MTTPTFQADPGEKIIVALDVASENAANKMTDILSGHGVGFKVGLELFSVAGPAFVAKLVEAGHRVFLDLKLHDIPNTVARAASEAARLGVWMMNVHALGGRQMMEKARDAVAESAERARIVRPKLLAVTILTSSTGDTLNEIGIKMSVEDSVIGLAALAADCGLDGVVASAKEAAMIGASAATSDLIIVTPGIRPAFATNNDQNRVTTPAEALRAGSTYLVIGRPITAASDPAAALSRIIEEIGQQGIPALGSIDS